MENRKDYFFRKAKEEGFLARSAYKLLELNKKYKLIKNGDRVLDLGCSPGSWTQVCLELKVRRIIGVDLTQTKVRERSFSFIHDDIGNIDVGKIGMFDVVLSDLAPSTSGIFDAEESVELSKKAWGIAKKVLKKDGNFLCKVFQGKGFEDFLRDVRKEFGFFKVSKPKASRKRSREIYLICKMFKR